MSSPDSLRAVPDRVRQLDDESLRTEFTWRVGELEQQVRTRLAAHEAARR